MTFGTKLTILNTFMWMIVAGALLIFWVAIGFSIERFTVILTIFAIYLYSRVENTLMGLNEKLNKVLSNQEAILKQRVEALEATLNKDKVAEASSNRTDCERWQWHKQWLALTRLDPHVGRARFSAAIPYK